MNTHLSRAAEIVGRMLLDPQSAFTAKPSRGTLRGIDIYPAGTLIRVIAGRLDEYQRVTGEWMPDPGKSILLREKIFWANFFRPMAIPTPADKLAVYSLLTADAKLRVKEPPKVWQGMRATLPNNDLVPPGSYYLKANHASQTSEKLMFPLDAERRAALEAKGKKWLQWRFGWKVGEWWYSTIRPCLFLEKELDLPIDHPGEFKFYTVNGRVTHLHVNWFTSEGRSTSVYDRDLAFIDVRYKNRPSARRKLRSKVADVTPVAEEIAKGTDYVRVDLYLDRNDTIWIGELTFAPASALGRYSSREFEIACCQDWDISKYLRAAV
jgi:hypothetical protein